MLARTIESLGIPTVTVTMMPALAEKFMLSRIVGVEFPFGHAFGQPNDLAMQDTVARAAVQLLREATAPQARLDVPIEWPIDTATAYRDWQPAEASPIVKYNLERRARLEQRRSE